jgi:GTP 3',8-cyclase
MKDCVGNIFCEVTYKHLNIPDGDLRISINSICNMQCKYCHNEGQQRKDSQSLTRDSIKYIISNLKYYGVQKVRLTGGEPLLHPDIFEICAMIRNDLHIETLGINTNCVFIDRLLPIIDAKLLDQIIVGLDYYDAPISKNSIIGVSSKIVLDNILNLKMLKQNPKINCVYNGDYENARKLTSWCLLHQVPIRFIEISNSYRHARTSKDFVTLFRNLTIEFNLKIGFIRTLSQYYGVNDDGLNVAFFHSHCRIRECMECSRLHLRVMANGFAKPCLLNKKTEFSLLDENIHVSALKAIHNLGVPPEKDPL